MHPYHPALARSEEGTQKLSFGVEPETGRLGGVIML